MQLHWIDEQLAERGLTRRALAAFIPGLSESEVALTISGQRKLKPNEAVAIRSFFEVHPSNDARDAKELAMLKAARANSGLPLDFWVDLTEGLDQRALEILVGRSSVFPKYINSKGNL